jgi:transcription initiation factor TFIIIB Brf1 subunit/transcription initiation factor TFIIB
MKNNWTNIFKTKNFFMSENKACSSCHETNLFHNEIEGSLICENCGTILEENIVREEVTFIKGDQKGINGSMLSVHDKNGISGLMMSSDTVVANEQKQVSSKRNSILKIEQILSSLKISKRFSTEVFVKVEKVAEGKFTKDKWLDEVICSCIYIVSRIHGFPITFLDLSGKINYVIKIIEVVGITLNKLGRTYKDVSVIIKKEFGIQVTSVDPESFVERMLGDLIEIKDIKVKENILRDSSRLLRLAKKEWLSCGKIKK